MEFLSNNTIQITPPKKPKKITGTRFAAVLGMNHWNTPFATWCDITKTYVEPFEGNQYTEAGKVIEPKIANYLIKKYFLDDLLTPTDVYGEDYFSKTWGNFYQDKIFGGMWDFIGDDYIVEVKTSSRPQDWQDEPPMYYVLQACLYAYLSKKDTVYLIVSFLEDKDYVKPNEFVPDVNNTKIYTYSMKKDFPDFESKYVAPALQWWNRHIVTGISPKYDEVKDKNIIKELKTNYATPTDDEVVDVLKELNDLDIEIAVLRKSINLDEKEAKVKLLKDKIKNYLENEITDGNDRATTTYDGTIYTVTKSTKKSIDQAKLKHDGLYLKYVKETTTTALRVSKEKGEN